MGTVFHPQDARFAERGSTDPGAASKPIGMTWRDARSLQEIRQEFASIPLGR
jgi:hypothetical protein